MYRPKVAFKRFNFIARYVIVFIHFKVFAATDKYVFVRMQTSGGDRCRHTNRFQFFQRISLKETDTITVRNRYDIAVA